MITAVIGTIIKDGKILSVSRKTNHIDRGFPGGKNEPGETDEQTLCREILEETGLTILSSRFIDERLDEQGVVVKMFVVDEYEGDISTNETGLVEWVSPIDLCTDNCSFKQYNKDLLNEFLFEEITRKYVMEDLVFIDESISDRDGIKKYTGTTVTSSELEISVTVNTHKHPAINRSIGKKIIMESIKILSV